MKIYGPFEGRIPTLQPADHWTHWTPGHMKCSEVLGLFVASDHRDLRWMMIGDLTIIQWIGLRENLQETMVFTIKYRAFL